MYSKHFWGQFQLKTSAKRRIFHRKKRSVRLCYSKCGVHNDAFIRVAEVEKFWVLNVTVCFHCTWSSFFSKDQEYFFSDMIPLKPERQRSIVNMEPTSKWLLRHTLWSSSSQTTVDFKALCRALLDRQILWRPLKKHTALPDSNNAY